MSRTEIGMLRRDLDNVREELKKLMSICCRCKHFGGLGK